MLAIFSMKKLDYEQFKSVTNISNSHESKLFAQPFSPTSEALSGKDAFQDLTTGLS